MSNVDRTRYKIDGVIKCVECGKHLYFGDGRFCSACTVRNWKKNNPEKEKILRDRHRPGERVRRRAMIKDKVSKTRSECMESIPKTMKICRKCSGPMGYNEVNRGNDQCKDCARHAAIKKIIGGWVIVLGKDSRKHRMHKTLLAIRGRCRKSGIPFDISVADINLPKLCPVFGIEILYDKLSILLNGGSVTSHPQLPSIDRLIPELGYIKGNVSIMSLRANTIKNSGTAEEHEKIAAFMRSRMV